MALKRPLREGGEEGSAHPVKRRHFISTIFKGLNNGLALEESLPCLEPMIRKVVQEEIKRAIDRHQGFSYNQIDSCRSRNLQLQFQSNLPARLFTGSKILSEDGNPIKVTLYNSSSNEIEKYGPLSSLKVTIVVLDGDFGLDDREDWTKKEFDSKTVKNREGKRPLVTGESTVMLQGGVGYIGEINFTDNSSWIRSGKFRLGAKVNNDELGIREAMSNAFKVKDHRGESYQKHYPPLLDDEVWRLEKIAKEGSSHKKLAASNISSVREFLRLYFRNQMALRDILKNVSEKTWETIIRHANTCTLDDEKYIYCPAQGTGLVFNSIHKVVTVTFDGHNYLPVDVLNIPQKRMVENLKHQAYRNITEWVTVCDSLISGYPLLMPGPETDSFTNPNLGFNGVNFQQDHREPEMSPNHPTLSPPYRTVIQQDSSFEVGETSYRYGSNISNSPGGLYIGGNHSWASGGNYVGSQISTDDLPIVDTFQLNSSPWQGNGSFLSPGEHQIGIISANPGFPNPRNGRPRTRWCKVLAVLKWRIVRRNVAARKWNYYSYM